MGDLQSVITQSKDGRLIIKRNISGANQLLHANHANFNLVHQGRGAGGWDERFAKCDYPIQGWTVNYKIIESSHASWMLTQWLKLKFVWLIRRC